MTSFLHGLPDPGANWCPNCGEPRNVCQCTEEDMNRWAHDVLYPDECLCHDLEEVWDDGVGQRCCFCLICGNYQIIQYETEDEQS